MKPFRRSGPSFSQGDLIHKPPGCSLCPNSARGHSFLPDKPNPAAKIAVMLDAPSADDLLYGEGLSNGVGYHFLKHNIEALGYQRSDLLVCHVLRCKQPGLGKDAYPQAGLRTNAENCCRVHDGALLAFNPNLFLITYDLFSVLRTQPLTRVVRRDVEKAFRFAEQGYRPLVLMGERPASLLFNYGFRPGNGGIKCWRGTWFQGEWPFKAS